MWHGMAYIGRKKKYGEMLKTQKEIDRRAVGKKECEIQNECEAILNALGIRFIHIPDIVYRMCSRFSSLKVLEKSIISKYLKGVPDLIILFRSGRYVCVELKKTDGTQQHGQKKFERDVSPSNYKIVRSSDGFVEVLREYGEVV